MPTRVASYVAPPDPILDSVALAPVLKGSIINGLAIIVALYPAASVVTCAAVRLRSLNRKNSPKGIGHAAEEPLREPTAPVPDAIVVPEKAAVPLGAEVVAPLTT